MRSQPLAAVRVVSAVLAVASLVQAGSTDEPIRPFPRERLQPVPVKEWEFQRNAEGWGCWNQCAMAVRDGSLRIQCLGTDPYFGSPPLRIETPGPLVLRLRMKARGRGPGQVFWVTVQAPRWSERRSTRFAIQHDGQWHEYEVVLPLSGALRQLRLDPGTGPGQIEIDWIRLSRFQWHPLEIESVATATDGLEVNVRNHSDRPIPVTVRGRRLAPATARLQPRSVTKLILPVDKTVPFGCDRIEVQSAGLPPLRRVVCWYTLAAKTDWMERRSKELVLQVAPDGSGAKLFRKGRLAAVIAPLVHFDGQVPSLKPTRTEAKAGPDVRKASVRFAGAGVAVELRLEADELRVTIRSPKTCEGPVVRVPGPLEQGLFAGLEYLGRGEHSSSKRDIETPEHLR
ncbi:MAG TPA: hypothetical protein EYP14_05880, partial [Planctomycetaceae bacterium]|nr:hypothetical protein [Planctomycetaceae bacterium]